MMMIEVLFETFTKMPLEDALYIYLIIDISLICTRCLLKQIENRIVLLHLITLNNKVRKIAHEVALKKKNDIVPKWQISNKSHVYVAKFIDYVMFVSFFMLNYFNYYVSEKLLIE